MAEAHGNRAALGIFDGVADQIVDNLPDSKGVEMGELRR
jgi:hypothetical protein